MLSSPVVIRLAEMYLIKAEICARDGRAEEAIRLVNILRERAGLTGSQLFEAHDLQGYETVLDVLTVSVKKHCSPNPRKRNDVKPQFSPKPIMMQFKRIAVVFLGMLSQSVLWAAEAPQQKQRPNIIWLMAEDMSLDLSCYGMEAAKTPHLDQLAASGWRFTNCFATSPICSPSRSAMLTGVHQTAINAAHHRSNRQLPLPEDVKPFTYWLREAGYTCVLGNDLVKGKGRKIDCNFKTSPLGEWDGKENFGLFDKYDELLPEDQPFFSQIQLDVTHRGDWWDEIRAASASPTDPDSVVLPPYIADNAINRLDWAKYLDQIAYMDTEVGNLIQSLKRKGLYENTVIIFIGDNGRCNIRGKGYLHDSGIHVPLIIHWPQGIREAAVREEVVSTLDLTATILALADAEMPAYLDGSSVMQADFSREYVYSARDLWDEVMDKSRSLTSSRFKYIRNDMPEVPWDAHQAYLEFYRPALHSMRRMLWRNELGGEARLFFMPTKPAEELYDLMEDPYELNNLAEDPGSHAQLEKLRELLRQHEAASLPDTSVFVPDFPIAVNVLEWVKYNYPQEYLRMLEGEEIGFQKYNRLYHESIKK
ncbi:sulfatase-like hydrolase/transferase [Parapedobacter sp. DT-150]|uniref:sulfatase family protein n=1 Tax=Parapedobacter sp. DT-150 TaxID=3396162 RepID=UPI003F1BE072